MAFDFSLKTGQSETRTQGAHNTRRSTEAHLRQKHILLPIPSNSLKDLQAYAVCAPAAKILVITDLSFFFLQQAHTVLPQISSATLFRKKKKRKKN